MAAKKKLFLIAGHGEGDPGACSIWGQEANYTRELAVGQRIERDANGKLFFRFSNNRPRSLEANGRLTAIIRHILGEY